MIQQTEREKIELVKIQGSLPQASLPSGEQAYSMKVLTGWRKTLVRFGIRKHLFFFAMKNYGSVSRSIDILHQLYQFKKKILGTDAKSNTKLVKINNKYYHTIFAPGYPSQAFDDYILGEFHRISPLPAKGNRLSFLFLAITKKCPLRCEHCYEWDNLNQQEALDLNDLKNIVHKFQEEGVAQFHLGGGEPMTRIKDLLSLANATDRRSEIYVLTSGFNFTQANAKALKDAGITGITVSIDHFDAEKHNAFRGFQNSFADAVKAIQHAQEQHLVVSVSICVTKNFISWNNLLKYAAFIKSLRVPFLQILEPKAVGHYKDKDVVLNGEQLRLLEKFYQTLNFDPAYKDYPVIIYTGYHQRRVGCLLGGNRILYIDSDGNINACPFCHTKSLNIKQALIQNIDVQNEVRKIGCKPYGLEGTVPIV